MRRYVLGAAALLLLLLGSQAVLAEYGASGSLTLSDPSPIAGGETLVSGSGFAPGSTVQVTIHSSPQLLATVTADPTGAFSALVSIPAAFSGPHTLSATGTDTAGSVRVLAVDLDVAAAASLASIVPAPGHAGTGSDTLVFAIAGVGIVLMTGVLLRVGRESLR